MKINLAETNVAHRRSGGVSFFQFLITPFYNAWQYRELIRVIVGRELTQRFRDSYFGWIWAILTPLLMLLVYVSVFSTTLKLETGSSMNFALSTFIALIIFNLFAELITRAPLLLSEHANVIKKTIFPSEVLAWTSMIRALAYAAIGFVIFLCFEIAIEGGIPITAFFFPIIILPLCLLLLGAVWFLAALGAFTRDISFMMSVVVPVLIFATPVFYTTLNFSPTARMLSYINPLTPFIEMAREIFLLGQAPDIFSYLIASVFSLCLFYGGYSFFMRFRSVVVDVL